MILDRVRRRMAAILAADVVGYSRLMGKDEEATLATLKANRQIIDGLIVGHGGRIFGGAGDSVIAEFASPVDAVRCATKIQLAVDKRNSEAPEDRRMRFRIGINLGDVVADGDNLMGDGVNVAARLEGLAPPGGICVSEAVHMQVRDRLALDFLDLGEHKVKNIARPVRAYRVPLASEERVESPFRGLDVFDFEHADLFFGRARATRACLERLEQLAGAGRAFLLIYGMSGSGKSSLLRAGLLPALIKPGAVAGIALWRRCLIRPTEGADAVAALAAGLLREEALPELGEDKNAAELAELLRAAPDRAPAIVRAALGKTAASAGIAPSQARLVVAVDQLEELFTAEVDNSAREALVRLVAALAGSGMVWVIATIRADFFHRCGEVPGFSVLKDGLASYELLPPTGPEIAQIIREPARAAGLRFEESAERGRLEDVLQEAAAADPGSLPLLQFVLDALYEAGRERGLLTFAAYRALGGLEGAIARRADEVIDALDPNTQEALPGVLRALTTVRQGEEAITASPALLESVAATPAQAALVDALIAARLLVSGEDAIGRAVIRVAHEALLSRWPRARDIVNANREFLETRARVQADARRWQSENRNSDLLLPAGKRLAEGAELLSSRRGEVDDRSAEYIEASLSADRARMEKDRQAERARLEAAIKLARRTRIAAGVALLLAIGAGVGAITGWLGQREAVRQAGRAEAHAVQAKSAETEALAAKDEALRSQSLALSFLAHERAASGDSEAAILLALEALPADAAAPDRPYLPDADVALHQALLGHRQTMMLRHDEGITHAAFSPDGERIATASFDKTARIWNAADGSEVAALSKHDGAVKRVAFSPNGDRLATAGRDGTVRVWDVGSGQQLFVLEQRGDQSGAPTAIFSPDGTRILTAGAGSASLWDAESGERIADVQSPSTSRAAFSPDGRTFAAGQGSRRTVRIWSAADGALVKSWDVRTWTDKVLFSADGSRLLASAWYAVSFSQMSRLFDISTGAEIAAFDGHRSDTHGGLFNPDGSLVATISMDGTARLWDGVTGELRRELGSETAGLTIGDALVASADQQIDSDFSPDGRMLATASIDATVYIWDVETGAQFAVIPGHAKFVEHVEFSPDGKRLLTASHDGTARLWDIDGVLTTTLRHAHRPTFAAFSNDGTNLVTLGNDNGAHIWNVAAGKEVIALQGQSGALLQHAVFSPDGLRLATAASDGEIIAWDIETRSEVARFEANVLGISNVEFSPDGRLLLSTTIDGTARLWNASTGAEVAAFGRGTIRKASFSPDGTLVLTGAEDGRVRLMRTDGSEFGTVAAPGSRISAAAFSTDGRLLVTGCFDGSAQIWSIDDGRLVTALEGRGGLLLDIDFSRDGQHVIGASRDGIAHIWRVEDGAEHAVLRGHDGAVANAEFSPGGLYAVTASSADRTARLWSVESGREIAILSGRDGVTGGGPALTHAAFSPDGAWIVALSGEEDVRIIRAFETPQQLIEYAHEVVPRELSPCERRRFFLPVEGEVGVCPD